MGGNYYKPHHEDHDDDDNDKLHIVMFPWLAFGHMIPFLELSKLLAEKGHKISFISTPHNCDRLYPLIPSHLLPLLRFVRIPLPSNENLHWAANSTNDVPVHSFPFLKLSFDLMQKPVEKFLEASRPDWLFFDFAHYWLPTVARRLRIPNGFFSAYTAAALCMRKPPGFEEDRTKEEDFTKPPKWVPFPTRVTLRTHEIRKMFEEMTAEQHGNVTDAFRIGTVMEECDVIAVRTSPMFEPEWLRLLEELYRKPIIPVGVLPPGPPDTTPVEDPIEGSFDYVKQWLDPQEPGSIVYVGFGSEAKPTQTEMNEIAHGLELSGLRFIWALKMRRGAKDPDLVDVPPEFEELRQGWIYRLWVDQPRVLTHPSIGCVLTQPGWGTAVEAVWAEKPLVMLTLMYDRGLNARVFEEKGIGIMVPRDEIDGSFTKKDVAESLLKVVEGEEGKICKEKMKEMKREFGDLSQQDNQIDCFLDSLRSRPETFRRSFRPVRLGVWKRSCPASGIGIWFSKHPL